MIRLIRVATAIHFVCRERIDASGFGIQRKDRRGLVKNSRHKFLPPSATSLSFIPFVSLVTSTILAILRL